MIIIEGYRIKESAIILLEKAMSVDEALKVFNIEIVPDPRELKQLYSKLSKENHPDRGGSTEKMIDINLAYEVLSRAKEGTKSGRASYDDYKKNEELKKEKHYNQWIYMKGMFERNFNEDTLLDYLESFTNEELYINIKEHTFMYSSYVSAYVTDIEVYNKDRSLVYYVKYYITPERQAEGGLGYEGIDAEEYAYSFDVLVEVLYNNRKQKMSQSKYQFRKGKKVMFDYEEIFPSSKLKKLFTGGGKKSFKKADFLLGLERGIPTKINSNQNTYYLYPFDTTKLYFHLERMTFNRVAAYVVKGIWGLNPKYQLMFFKDRYFLPETEEAMIAIKDFMREGIDLVERKRLDYIKDVVEIHAIFNNLTPKYFSNFDKY